MTDFEFIVIGGGVSGLMLASRTAGAGRSTLLLEAQGRLGGCLQTWQATPAFWVELGAHTAYNSYKALLEVLAERGGLEKLLPRRKLGYTFLQDGRLQSPFARLGWLELLTHLPAGLRRKQDGMSLSAYYGALFGPANYARMLGPAFSAVLSQPADDFPAQWLFRRKPRYKQAPRKYSWPTGLQGMAEALAAGAAFRLRMGTPVTAVRRVSQGYGVYLGEDMLSCRQLVLATPPDVAARLLADAHPDISARLAAIPMADIETMAVAAVADRVRLPPIAGLIGVDDDFYSVVSRDPIACEGLRGFACHFRPGRLDGAGRLRRIIELLGISRDDLVGYKEAHNRLPALDVSHVALAAEVDGQLARLPLGLAGNYFNGLSIGDCADRASREAERLLAT